MWDVHQHELIACAAILLAGTILGLAPGYVRKAFVILVFATGLLSWVSSLAEAFAAAAVVSLFG
jgi:uncharacterized membrane protein